MGLASPMASAKLRTQRFSTSTVNGAYSLPMMLLSIIPVLAFVSPAVGWFAAAEAHRGNEGALGFGQVLAHGQGGCIAVARRERRGDALQSPQHDSAHPGVAQGERAQVLHVVGVEFDRVHQAPIR